MATTTEHYGLIKPDRLDNVSIKQLNDNFDLIDKELNSRPLSSDIPGQAYYDVDLTETADFDLDESYMEYDIPEGVDIGAILTAADEGKTIRVWCKDSTRGGAPFSVLLPDRYVTITDEATFTYLCGIASDPYVGYTHSEFVFLDTDVNGTHSAALRRYGDFPHRFLDAVKGEVVQTINGEAPDENGNVEINVVAKSESATATLNFDNWDAAEGAYYRETLEDGSSITHAIERDASGNIISIGGIAIEGVE